MKITLPLAFCISLFCSTITNGQAWPFPNPKPSGAYINTRTPPPSSVSLLPRCTKWPVTNNGQWDNPGTWNGNSVPTNLDIVCIPGGWTVIVKGATYTPENTTTNQCQTNPAQSPRLYIFVTGTIDFDPSGKLYLGCGSQIVLYASPTIGKIAASNGSSDLIQIGPTIVWGGPGTNNQPDLNGPYSITGGGQGPGILPFTLTNFNTELKGPNEVSISWSTASESNSKEFVVERSSDNKNWESIATVTASGNSTTQVLYNYTDRTPKSGSNYYRLRMVQLSGESEYSLINKVIQKTTGKIFIYPNPAVSNATLYSSDLIARNQSIQLYNMNGAFIQTISSNGSNVLQFSTTHLAPGLYLIRIVENGKTIAETKLIKQ